MTTFKPDQPGGGGVNGNGQFACAGPGGFADFRQPPLGLAEGFGPEERERVDVWGTTLRTLRLASESAVRWPGRDLGGESDAQGTQRGRQVGGADCAEPQQEAVPGRECVEVVGQADCGDAVP